MNIWKQANQKMTSSFTDNKIFMHVCGDKINTYEIVRKDYNLSEAVYPTFLHYSPDSVHLLYDLKFNDNI